MQKLRAAFLILGLLSSAISARADELVKADHIQVSLVAPQEFSAAKTTVGVRYEMEKGWHVYWKNPGDSGSAPKFEFAVQEASVGEIQWPAPHRMPIGDLVNLGYEKSIILPFEITPDSGAKKISLEAKLEWLVCNEGECVPGFGTLKLERPVGAAEKWNESERKEIQNSIARIPHPSEASPWKLKSIDSNADGIVVAFVGTGDVNTLEIFPTDKVAIKPQAPQRSQTSDGVSFAFKLQPGQTAPGHPGFVLVDGAQAWEWGSSAPDANSSVDPVALLVLLLSAFVGGILLNFMPCVLPVLTIKFLSMSQADPSNRVREALLYSLGVVVTFALLGWIFLSLRSAGAAIGWGFQLQSPRVIWALIVLFYLMALNFLGVFEFGTSIMNKAGKSRFNGAFATGVLSVFIAAPCTGPFMGTALGAAATLPALPSLAIFVFLGLGLASPFALIAISPRARGLIPKPGAWMETLKQFFAFPLFATVIWLLWVLHIQVGVDGLPLSLGALLTFGLFFWIGNHFRRGKYLMWFIASLVFLYVTLNFTQRANDVSAATSHAEGWEAFTPAKVEAAQAQGKAVFIDFTAAWCITCQFNKKTVLRTERIQKFFADKGIVLFEADWTKHDPIITEALAKLGRNSVPVYVFYAPGSKEPKILPQLLTPSDIEGLL